MKWDKDTQYEVVWANGDIDPARVIASDLKADWPVAVAWTDSAQRERVTFCGLDGIGNAFLVRTKKLFDSNKRYEAVFPDRSVFPARMVCSDAKSATHPYLFLYEQSDSETPLFIDRDGKNGRVLVREVQ